MIDHHTGIQRERKKPTDVYVSIMDFPASIIDSLAVKATNDDSDIEYEQAFVGSCVAVKLVVVTFFGTIISC